MGIISNFEAASRPKKKSVVFISSPLDDLNPIACMNTVDRAAREAIACDYLEDCFTTKLAVMLAKFYYYVKSY